MNRVQFYAIGQRRSSSGAKDSRNKSASLANFESWVQFPTGASSSFFRYLNLNLFIKCVFLLCTFISVYTRYGLYRLFLLFDFWNPKLLIRTIYSFVIWITLIKMWNDQTQTLGHFEKDIIFPLYSLLTSILWSEWFEFFKGQSHLFSLEITYQNNKPPLKVFQAF